MGKDYSFIVRRLFMDKSEIKNMIGWLERQGHTDKEILDCIRCIVGAPPRQEEDPAE